MTTTSFQFPTADTVLSVLAIAGVAAAGALCVLTSGIQAIVA